MICAVCLLAAASHGDPVGKTSTGAKPARSPADAPFVLPADGPVETVEVPAGRQPAAPRGRGWTRLWLVCGLVLAGAVAVFLANRVIQRRLREKERQAVFVARARQRARHMLNGRLTLDEAQRIAWAWEEMTEAERASLPLERRVETRRIVEELADHKRKWQLD